MSYYIGNNPQDVLNGILKRYFYGIRRNADGELFLIKLDQLQGGEDVVAVINDVGIEEENFPDFEDGIDFLDGITADGEIEYPNLRYPQFRWDGRSLTYYIDPTDGQFIQRISEVYVYPENISSPGYGDVSDTEVLK